MTCTNDNYMPKSKLDFWNIENTANSMHDNTDM